MRLAQTGREALVAASADEPDLVILDLGLPDLEGVEVCRRLRRWFANPILVVCADGSEDRGLSALGEGADDLVTKPFSMPELLARLRVAARHRQDAVATAGPAVVEAVDLLIDTDAQSVLVGGRPLELTRGEFALLSASPKTRGESCRTTPSLNADLATCPPASDRYESTSRT